MGMGIQGRSIGSRPWQCWHGLPGAGIGTRVVWLKSIGWLAARRVTAVIGGYILATFTAVAAVDLPLPRAEAVITGMMASFAVYAGAAVWAFAARSASRAWIGLLIAGALPSIAVWPAWGETL